MNAGRSVLAAHGLFLFLLGSALVTRTVVGRLTASGAFAFLADNPVAAVGFHEAYGIVALMGVAIALGALSSRKPRPFHLLAAALHGFLLAINLAHWRLYAVLDMVTAGYLSTAMHVLLTIIELTLAAWARPPGAFRASRVH